MNVKCTKCGEKVGISRNHTDPELIKYADVQIYICKQCRKKVVFSELRRMAKKKGLNV